MSKTVSLPSLLRGLLLTGVAVVLLYVLSAGPAEVLYNRIPSEPLRSSIVHCYRPLTRLCANTPLWPPIGAYTGWWNKLAPFIEMPEPKVTNAPPPSQP